MTQTSTQTSTQSSTRNSHTKSRSFAHIYFTKNYPGPTKGHLEQSRLRADTSSLIFRRK